VIDILNSLDVLGMKGGGRDSTLSRCYFINSLQKNFEDAFFPKVFPAL